MSGGRLISLYINNRSGGLIYQRVRPAARAACPLWGVRCRRAGGMEASVLAPSLAPRASRARRLLRAFSVRAAALQNLSPSAAKLRDNDQLTVASMLSSIALILKELCPTTGSRPMKTLEANGFVLCSYDVPTGLKMVMLAEPGTQGARAPSRAARTPREPWVPAGSRAATARDSLHVPHPPLGARPLRGTQASSCS